MAQYLFGYRILGFRVWGLGLWVCGLRVWAESSEQVLRGILFYYNPIEVIGG